MEDFYSSKKWLGCTYIYCANSINELLCKVATWNSFYMYKLIFWRLIYTYIFWLAHKIISFQAYCPMTKITKCWKSFFENLEVKPNCDSIGHDVIIKLKQYTFKFLICFYRFLWKFIVEWNPEYKQFHTVKPLIPKLKPFDFAMSWVNSWILFNSSFKCFLACYPVDFPTCIYLLQKATCISCM